MVDALREAGHPCDAETERRVLQGDVAQGVVVAQSGDLAALRALQERLVALGCGAFVSESSSWRASVWESLRGLLELGGGGGGNAGAKARAVLGVVALLAVLLAVAAGLARLAGSDRRTSDGSPFDSLTETREGARTPRDDRTSPEAQTTERTRREGAAGGAVGGDARESEGDISTTLFELGAFLGGLIVALGLVSLALRVRGAPPRKFSRAARAVGVVLLGAGLWAGTRPREVERAARTSSDDTGGDLLIMAEGTIDGLDGGTEDYNDDAGEGDVSDDAGARRRELRGPFDRFLQRMSGRLPHSAAPSYASLLESLRASAPSSTLAMNVAPAPGAPEQHATPERASGRHHRGERRARRGHGHGHGSDRHAESASAATASNTDAGLPSVVDASLAAPVVTVDAATSSALTVTHLSDPERAPEVRPRAGRRSVARRSTVRPGVGPLGAGRELPRLGAWCLVGFALGVVIAARPRSKEVAS